MTYNAQTQGDNDVGARSADDYIVAILHHMSPPHIPSVKEFSSALESVKSDYPLIQEFISDFNINFYPDGYSGEVGEMFMRLAVSEIAIPNIYRGGRDIDKAKCKEVVDEVLVKNFTLDEMTQFERAAKDISGILN